ncbi:DUF3734 domain-containing protein [Beijerinckia indica]|uniref:Patatin n=1 Tax=Beijerinckia indica subsp. indica (strain ATCC 9039 / DSM 1715 / NCIMB 8712) TaxID=395963 RepID=B2IDP4_BEII9|nr:patatin-like phospholipase family protein [Beijerinckia indica]ACB95480.1 Patatin [Beijerinckia indica subsp. indica ATCC 9039]
MSDPITHASSKCEAVKSKLGQVVLVFQGGGALGAYQVGVYEALHAAGIEPDWLIGTSIGAVNASIIAGNQPQDRLDKLQTFWRRVEYAPQVEAMSQWPLIGPWLANWNTVTTGINGFFTPNPMAFMGMYVPLAPDAAGYYSIAPLQETLEELVDFSYLSEGKPRLTVGAAKVRTCEMRYFDSKDMPLTVHHIMASGALPPAFPPVRIDGDLYWDGGLLSNTPVEAIFDMRPRRSALIFAVDVWNPDGPEPESIWRVINRQKDIQYSSRAMTQIIRQRQIHRLRHIIAELSKRIPEPERQSPEVREMASYGCQTRMHVVHLLAPLLEGEGHTKDIDFSQENIRRRWEAGISDARHALEVAPWEGDLDPLEGLYLHEFKHGTRGETIRKSWHTPLPTAAAAE